MDWNLVNLSLLLIISTSFTFTASDRSSSSVVAKRIQDRYEDTATECKDSNGNDKSLYACSGILIRGVNNNRGLPYAWSLKPFNKQKHSFAFAYLRQDIQWKKLPFSYESGFILYPLQKIPKEKETYRVLCAFPLDAYTDHRTGKHACGRNKYDNKGESHHCDKQGITTFKAWKDHYERVGSVDYFHHTECGFDMTVSSAPELFRVVIEANKFLRSTRFRENNNEILIQSWNEENAQKLPIEAFFYVKDSATGEAYAREYQRSFEEKSGGEKVPVVSIQFPSSNGPFKVWPA